MKLRKQIHFTADRKFKHHNFKLNGKWMWLNTKFKHSQQASSKKEPKKTKSLILFLITYLENHGHYFLRIQKKTHCSSPMLPLFIYPSNFNFNYRRQEERTQPEMLNKKIESKPEQQISHL